MSCSSGSATPVPTAGAAAAAAQDDDEEEEAGEGSGGGVRFHPRCGHMVSLSGCRRVAVRAHAAQEFNHGVVMSARPLQVQKNLSPNMELFILLLAFHYMARW